MRTELGFSLVPEALLEAGEDIDSSSRQGPWSTFQNGPMKALDRNLFLGESYYRTIPTPKLDLAQALGSFPLPTSLPASPAAPCQPSTKGGQIGWGRGSGAALSLLPSREFLFPSPSSWELPSGLYHQFFCAFKGLLSSEGNRVNQMNQVY